MTHTDQNTAFQCSCCSPFSLTRALGAAIRAATPENISAQVHDYFRQHPAVDATNLRRPGSYVFTGGTIMPLSEKHPESVEAMLVVGDKIVKVGTYDEVVAKAPPGHSTIQLGGACLMPGFIEPHAHNFVGAITSLLLDLSPAIANSPQEYTIELVMQKLQDAVDASKPEGWVLAAGFDASKLQPWANLTQRYFEKLSNPHDVAILVLSGSGHISYGNDVAIRVAGDITDSTEDPPGGIIGKFQDSGPDGRKLSGVFVESPAQSLLMAALTKRAPPPGLFDIPCIIPALMRIWKSASASGLTTVNDAGLGLTLGYDNEKPTLSILASMLNHPLRLANAVYLDEWNASSDYPPVFCDGPDRSNPLFFVQAIKLFADGSNQGVTGYQREPYTAWALERTANDYLASHVRGNPDIDVDGLGKIIGDAIQQKWQVMVHANGDASIDTVIKAHGKAGTRANDDLRHRIEHCSVLHDDQISGMQDLGLVPSFLIEHLGNWGEVLGNILGERVQLLDRCKSAVNAGMRISLHSDYPVTSFSPLLEIQDAVTRIVRSTGDVLNEGERLTVIEALKAKTIDAAWQCHLDEYVGSLDEGKFADLVVLQKNPVDLEDPKQIADIPVLQTWVAGRQTYAVSAQ